MDQTTLIEDIISTKNTLTILHQVFIVNHISLQAFSTIFDLITELIDILTHSSAKQIEAAFLSTGSEFAFNKLKDTLNEISNAITTKNTLIINSLNEQLSSSVQKLQICSSYAANNEETADDIFKKELLQSHINAKIRLQAECYEALPTIPVSHSEYDVVAKPSICLDSEEKQKKSSIIDHFAQFRFARRKHSSISSEDEKTAESGPPPPPPPQSTISHSSNDWTFSRPDKLSTGKPRLMISYNHSSKPLCIEIYNSLTNDGYKVWIDLNQMHGSTLVAMAQGIEDSDIILYCVTENYSQSPNCQKEAEYAFVQQKIMIPLLLQSKYKPTGWLGLLMGASLYIDFTKNDFTKNYTKLKSEIEANTVRISSNKNDVPKLTLDSNKNDKGQTHTRTDNPSFQLTKTSSALIVRKSRSCVLF